MSLIKNQEHQIGDIAVFYYGDAIQHTAVYIGNEDWFHKAGMSGQYVIDTFEGIKKQYDYKIHFARKITLAKAA